MREKATQLVTYINVGAVQLPLAGAQEEQIVLGVTTHGGIHVDTRVGQGTSNFPKVNKIVKCGWGFKSKAFR